MVKSVFDIHTRRYDDWFVKNEHVFISELIALRGEFPCGQKGLDIGIGTGRFAQMLNIDYGVDISYSMVKIAKGRGCMIAVADAAALPFGAEEFDYGLLMVTLCFVQFPLRVIQEAHRVLTTGGKLIIGIIDKENYLGKQYLRKNTIFYKSAHFYSTKEVVELIAKNHFHNIKIWQTLFNNPDTLHRIDRVTKGHNIGGFVVISGTK
jgi:ubiquinone/menaquinone biosynthesis C-methylase UbiE